MRCVSVLKDPLPEDPPVFGQLATVSGPIVVDVVELQKHRTILSAADAAASQERHGFQAFLAVAFGHSLLPAQVDFILAAG